MKMPRSVWGALALLFLAFAPEVALAQPGQGPPPEGREHLERRVRERFDGMIRTALSIDETTATRLRVTMDSFQPERRTLSMREGELRREMRELDSILGAAEAQAMLDALIEVQQAEVELFAREQQALLAFLTPGQLLRFYAVRDQFGDRVRELRGEPTGARRGGGGGR